MIIAAVPGEYMSKISVDGIDAWLSGLLLENVV